MSVGSVLGVPRPGSPIDDSALRVVVHDATLRDGQHAVAHQLDAPQLRAYAQAADRARVAVVEVGHGNGLGASSIQIGRSRLPDEVMLSTVRAALTHSRMGVFMAPGWGRGDDVRRAVGLGVPRNSGGLEVVILGLTWGNASRRLGGACL